jgi:glyoxalase family protein
MKTTGLHHVTAIASDAQRNHDFYTQVLGLRLVKTTVNFDDPGSYHTYFGDYRGSPGTIITFFPWPGAYPGKIGAGYTAATAYTIPRGATPFWQTRLADKHVRGIDTFTRFGEPGVRFEDTDGMIIELIERDSTIEPHPDNAIPDEHAIRGFHSVTLLERKLDGTASTLTDKLGYRAEGVEGNRHRFVARSDAHGRVVDVIVDPAAGRGSLGAGSVHHVAFRSKDDAEHVVAMDDLRHSGFNVSPVMDRNYFHSIYFREPGGVLFEIATDSPGMDVDEPLESLGQSLRLPANYEKHRAEIERALPPLERR